MDSHLEENAGGEYESDDKRDAPAPDRVCRAGGAGGEDLAGQDRQDRDDRQGQRVAGVDARSVQTATRPRCVLHRERVGRRVLAAEEHPVKQAQEDEGDNGKKTPGVVARQDCDQSGADREAGGGGDRRLPAPLRPEAATLCSVRSACLRAKESRTTGAAMLRTRHFR